MGMRLQKLKAILKTAVSGAALLLVGVGSASAQTVNITAAPATATLPDGSAVPMWGYRCGINPSVTVCRPLNPKATANPAVWSPIVINASPAGNLTINLTNNLTFPTSDSNNSNQVPTSLVIVGQLGGGLGGKPTTTDSPTHDAQGATWPIANAGPIFTPPAQGPRVQSFGTEVLVGTPGQLTWSNLKPGTYLLESGTHPSIQATMGLVGIVVVPGSSGAPYADVTAAASVPLLFSEIDPAQNKAVDAAVRTTGFSESATRGGAFVGGPLGTLAVTNGGTGYTSKPTVTFSPAGSPDATVT